MEWGLFRGVVVGLGCRMLCKWCFVCLSGVALGAGPRYGSRSLACIFELIRANGRVRVGQIVEIVEVRVWIRF